jgi:NADH:ubiquinone reductase (H+-translocating)
MQSRRIIIIGGGFGGAKCAKTLRSIIGSECEITLFSQENHMVFHPLLAEVAAAKVQPKDMAAVLRELLKGVHCRTEDVLNIDLANNQIEYESDDGRERFLPYDQLVIASGNTSNLAVIPGMADHAFPLKTVGDALALQSHVIDRMEKAEVCDNPERKRWYLSFVVVGGGFSGVEMAGELNDLVKESAKFYPNFKREDVTVTLVHSHDQILPEVCTSLRDFAKKEMEKNGVNFILNAHADHCTPDGVGLKDGKILRAGTVVCTIGSRMLPMLERLNVTKEKGRLVTNPDMSLPGTENVWAIGDCAAIMNAQDGQLSPTTGQFAERQGSQAAHNIVARLQGRPSKPFSHKSLGMLCSIGGKSAVAEMPGGIKISGLIGWFAWRAVYLVKLPSFAQQIRVGAAWAFDLIFPPALTSVRVDQTRHIGRAHYASGDFIFKKGDPASDFYVIEEGQVETINDFNGHTEIISVLGAGDFFGEEALIYGDKRHHSCRARTESEIMILGKNIFTEISSYLAPMKNAIATGLKRRNSIWQSMSEDHETLQNIPLASLVEPLGGRVLKPDTYLQEAIDTISNNRFDLCFVADENNRLLGIITRGDLMRAIETAAAAPEASRHLVKVKDIMVPSPLGITTSDTTLFAISTMREHGYTRLPVIESSSNATLKGYLRVEHIMQAIAKHLLAKREGEKVSV